MTAKSKKVEKSRADKIIKWKINHLRTCFFSSGKKFSEEFTLEQNEIEFSLYFDSCSPFAKPGYKPLGVMLRKFNKTDSVKATVKLWIETDKGAEMADHLFSDFVFSGANKKCGFSLEVGKEFKFFNNCFVNDGPLILCAFFQYNISNKTATLLAELSNSPEANLTVKIQDRTIKVNKKAMINASPCFEKLLSAPGVSVLELDDLPEDVGEELIVWIHFKKINSLASTVSRLFVVAEKYVMTELRLKCLESMAHNVSAEDLFTFLVLGFMYEKDAPQLKQDVLKFAVQKHHSKTLTPLFNSPEWAELVSKDRKLADRIMNEVFEKMKVA